MQKYRQFVSRWQERSTPVGYYSRSDIDELIALAETPPRWAVEVPLHLISERPAWVAVSARPSQHPELPDGFVLHIDGYFVQCKDRNEAILLKLTL